MESWPGPVVGLSAVIVLIILLFLLVPAIAVDRNRIRREAAVVVAAGKAHRRRQELIDSLFREVGTGLPALVGSVAYRLRSPLAEMSTEAEALHREAAGLFTSDQRVVLDRMRADVRRLQELNEKLLDYATSDCVALHLSDVDLTVLAVLVAADRHALSTGPAPRIAVSDLPKVRGDASLLRQVLDNLVRNAVEHAIPGEPARVTITAVPVGPSAWRIEVADRGAGIPATNRTHLFEAFHRAHAGRPATTTAGLGLAEVRRIVQRHGGCVGADPNPGGGARFWFTLPTTGPADPR